MARNRRSHRAHRPSRPGSSPGTLRAPKEQRVDEVTLTVLDYSAEHVEEKTVRRVEEVFEYRDETTVTWIDVVGLHDVAVLETLGEHYGLHPLALEDVLNTGHRPKAEEYDDHEFIILRQVQLAEDREGSEGLDTEQICIFLGEGWVISFQEVPGDVFEPVRERIRGGKGRIRRLGADYLAYALLDTLVDHFFPVLERFGERIEDIEEEVVQEPVPATLTKIHEIKKELLQLRRAAWPLREVISTLGRLESKRMEEETRVFLRDCYDHTVQILDVLETYRDLASGMLDVYLSSVSNRMNEVMKVLTVMASIFIPLTFIVGVYGMNFDPEASPWNMPELEWAWGYPAVWAVMIALGVGMYFYFRRKGWM
jgi:magnesium transporter